MWESATPWSATSMKWISERMWVDFGKTFASPNGSNSTKTTEDLSIPTFGEPMTKRRSTTSKKKTGTWPALNSSMQKELLASSRQNFLRRIRIQALRWSRRGISMSFISELQPTRVRILSALSDQLLTDFFTSIKSQRINLPSTLNSRFPN